MLVSGAMLASVDAVSKLFVATYSVSQILFVQSSCACAALVLFAALTGTIGRLRPRDLRTHLIRGCLYAAGAYAFITALRYLPLADAVALSFVSPVLIALLGRLMLGEIVTRARAVAIVIGFVGVLVMLRPGTPAMHWAFALPLVVATVDAFRDILTRRMTVTETSQAVILFTTAVVAVVSAPLAIVHWQPIVPTHWLLYAGTGAFFIAAHYLMVEAFRHGEAVVVAPFRYFMLIWSTLFGFALFDDLPDAWVVTGALLTVVGGIIIAVTEASKPRDV